MSARNHPRLIGAFLLGAVALALTVIVLVSSGGWFTRKDRFALYFPGSVRGLRQGAHVAFRGVRVGEVVDITPFLTGEDPWVQIEVVIEFRRAVFQPPAAVPEAYALLQGPELAQALIGAGLKARMLSQSLLTGERYIELDFLPDETGRLTGIKRRYPELPTTPTSIEKLGGKAEDFIDRIAALPLDEMIEDVRSLSKDLHELSPDLKGTLSGTHRAARDLDATLTEARLAMTEARALMNDLAAEVKGTGEQTRGTLDDVRRTLERAEGALKTLETTLHGTDQSQTAATEALDELSRTLKALRNLADYIQTHPEALALGKERGPSK